MSAFTDMLAEYRAGLGDYVAPVAAAEFVAGLDAKGKRALTAWLNEHAVRLVSDELTRLDRSDRATTRARSGSRAFAGAVEAADAGESERLSIFATYFVVDDDNLRRRVGEMTGADHHFVADLYEVRGKRDLMHAAFHRAVAKKVGSRRTADVLDEGTYVALLGSLTGEPTPQPKAA